MLWQRKRYGPILTAEKANRTPTSKPAGKRLWIFAVLAVFLFLLSLVLGADFIFIGHSQSPCRLTIGKTMLLASRPCASNTDLK